MSDTRIEPTLDDIATRVCDYYHELKSLHSSEKTKVLFNKAITKFFNSWGNARYTLEEFKSLMSARLQARKKKLAGEDIEYQRIWWNMQRRKTEPVSKPIIAPDEEVTFCFH
jgi:hypothetical protein